MARKQPADGIAGERIRCTEPDWEPLRNLLDDEVVEGFMWMGEIALENGTKLQIFKHRWSRRSIHLSSSGEAYYYDWEPEDDPDRPRLYVKLPVHEALAAVLGWPRWPEHDRYIETIERWRAEDEGEADAA